MTKSRFGHYWRLVSWFMSSVGVLSFVCGAYGAIGISATRPILWKLDLTIGLALIGVGAVLVTVGYFMRRAKVDS